MQILPFPDQANLISSHATVDEFLDKTHNLAKPEEGMVDAEFFKSLAPNSYCRRWWSTKIAITHYAIYFLPDTNRSHNKTVSIWKRAYVYKHTKEFHILWPINSKYFTNRLAITHFDVKLIEDNGDGIDVSDCVIYVPSNVYPFRS